MGEAGSSETILPIYKDIRRQIPVYLTADTHCLENLICQRYTWWSWYDRHAWQL